MIARAGGVGSDELPLTSAEPTVSSDPPLLVRLAPLGMLYEDSVGGGVDGGGSTGPDEGTNSTIKVSMRVAHPKDVSARGVRSKYLENSAHRPSFEICAND